MMTSAMELASSFMATMVAAGICPVNAGAVAADLLSGRLVRFPCIGERKPNGWAVLLLGERPAGAFGNWRMGRSGLWRPAGQSIIRPTRFEVNRLSALRRARRLELQEEVAAEAQDQWSTAHPANPDHPYLAAKRMTGAGLRQSGSMLLVPMRDAGGRLWNLQRIGVDGRKLFLKGARVAGLGWQRGRLSDAADMALVIGEGVATMAAVHAATGLPVLAAFSANNLGAVSQAVAARRPKCRLILAADMDPNETGQRACREAAETTGGSIAFAPRPPGWPSDSGWDFADALCRPGGVEAIRHAFHGIADLPEQVPQ